MNEQTEQPISRRDVLQGVAGGLLVVPGLSEASRTATARVENGADAESVDGNVDTESVDAAAASTLTVMTWNLYVGTDLRKLLAGSDEELPTAVATLLADIEASRFDARVEAIADAIATVRPDLVGLQEVTLLRLQLPGDYAADPGRTNAGEYHLDFLSLLQEHLAERGVAYDAVSSISNTDVELPAALDAGSVDVRFTDRDVILARSGVETGEVTRRTYDATLTIPLPDGVEFPLTRGYCAVDVDHNGTAFTFVNTHLDSVSVATQLDQVRELVVDLAALDRPIVLVGDFNSPADGSETVTYDLLTQFFTDAYAEAVPGDPGYTCCRQPRLQRRRSKLSKRLDLVLLRGVGPVTAADRVGTDRSDRVSAVVDGEHRRLWPSDHAGVVATLQLEPDGASDEATSQSGTRRESGVDSAGVDSAGVDAAGDGGVGRDPAAGNDESSDVDAPGFGVVAGLFALGAVAVGLLRRRRASESTRFSRPPEK